MSDELALQISNLKSHFFTSKGVVPAVDGVSIDVPPGKLSAWWGNRAVGNA